MKKLLSMTMALIMILSLFSVSAFADTLVVGSATLSGASVEVSTTTITVTLPYTSTLTTLDPTAITLTPATAAEGTYAITSKTGNAITLTGGAGSGTLQVAYTLTQTGGTVSTGTQDYAVTVAKATRATVTATPANSLFGASASGIITLSFQDSKGNAYTPAQTDVTVTPGGSYDVNKITATVTSATTLTITTKNAASGKYTFTVQDKNAAGTATVAVYVGITLPTISANPVGAEYLTGESAIPLAVTMNPAVGTSGDYTYAYTYQWQKDNVNISGATAATYTPGTAKTDAGSHAYRCVVGYTVSDGATALQTGTLNSTAATVKVYEPYTVTISSTTDKVATNGNLGLTAVLTANTRNSSTGKITSGTVPNKTVTWSVPNTTNAYFGANSMTASSMTNYYGTAAATLYGKASSLAGITVTASFVDGSNTYSATKTIYVQDNVTVTLGATSASIGVGEVSTAAQVAAVMDGNAYVYSYANNYSGYRYTATYALTSGTNVVTLDPATGTVTGKAVGQAVVTATVTVYYNNAVVGTQTATCTFNVADSSIEYYVNYASNVTFDEDDFQSFFQKAYGWTSGSYQPTLSYVVFNVNGLNSTINGYLYTKNTAGVMLTSATSAYYNANANAVDLDALTYMPGSRTAAYTVSIPFTAYGYRNNSTYSNALVSQTGTVTIHVNSQQLQLTMNLTSTLPTTLAGLNSDLVSAIVASRTGITANSVTISNITFGTQHDNFGTLYSNSSKLAIRSYGYSYDKTGTAANTTGIYYFHNLYFVPTSTDNGGYYQLPFQVTSNYGTYTGLLTIKVPVNGLPFTDVTVGSTYYTNIQYVYSHGIMNGKTNTYFDINGSVTRGQLVAMLYRIAGSPSTYNYRTLSFKDTSSIAASFVNAVKWASATGIVGGYADGTFKPNDAVTRQAMVKILYGYATLKAFDTYVPATFTIAGYSDAGKVASGMSTAMRWAIYNKFVSGYSDNTLRPVGATTRGAAAKIVSTFHQTFIGG